MFTVGCADLLLALTLSSSANSEPPGKADRLPPQVTRLLNGDQKLPRAAQAAQLLRSGAVRALQTRHGGPRQGAHPWKMSSAEDLAQTHGHLSHAFLICSRVTYCYSRCSSVTSLLLRFYPHNIILVLFTAEHKGWRGGAGLLGEEVNRGILGKRLQFKANGFSADSAAQSLRFSIVIIVVAV